MLRDYKDSVQTTQQVKLEINSTAQSTEFALRTMRCHSMVPNDKGTINKHNQTAYLTVPAMSPSSTVPTQRPVAGLSDARLHIFFLRIFLMAAVS